jgi:hypothetical protein
MTGRGQTEFDYVVGMTLVLLTLTGVFTFVPGIYEPFDDPVATDDTATADRIADDLLTVSAVQDSSNTVNRTKLEANIDAVDPPTDTDTLNVTLQDGTEIVTGTGSSYADNRQPSATTVRVVTFATDDTGTCEPICRLIVRVW